MLTRLEVDGFKNLLGFSVDFGPLTCIAGPNGVGKSNIFDAIELLSLLVDHPLMEATARVHRDPTGPRDPGLLFWRNGDERSHRIRLAAEMLVEPEARGGPLKRLGPPCATRSRSGSRPR